MLRIKYSKTFGDRVSHTAFVFDRTVTEIELIKSTVRSMPLCWLAYGVLVALCCDGQTGWRYLSFHHPRHSRYAESLSPYVVLKIWQAIFQLDLASAILPTSFKLAANSQHTLATLTWFRPNTVRRVLTACSNIAIASSLLP